MKLEITLSELNVITKHAFFLTSRGGVLNSVTESDDLNNIVLSWLRDIKKSKIGKMNISKILDGGVIYRLVQT